MPTARELLEQADALMRRNRGDTGIPVLTDSVPDLPPPQRNGPATRERAGTVARAQAAEARVAPGQGLREEARVADSARVAAAPLAPAEPQARAPDALTAAEPPLLT